MKPGIHLVVTLAAVIGGCGGGNADAFVGNWVYAGMITPNCLGTQLPAFDLSGATVTITKTDSEHVQVVLDTSCVVTFTVDGNTAKANANSICTLDVPTIGVADITITTWTLTLADGVMTSNFQGSALGLCSPSGTGTLTRQAEGGV
jgi:hypothetical protein